MPSGRNGGGTANPFQPILSSPFDPNVGCERVDVVVHITPHWVEPMQNKSGNPIDNIVATAGRRWVLSWRGLGLQVGLSELARVVLPDLKVQKTKGNFREASSIPRQPFPPNPTQPNPASSAQWQTGSGCEGVCGSSGPPIGRPVKVKLRIEHAPEQGWDAVQG